MYTSLSFKTWINIQRSLLVGLVWWLWKHSNALLHIDIPCQRDNEINIILLSQNQTKMNQFRVTSGMLEVIKSFKNPEINPGQFSLRKSRINKLGIYLCTGITIDSNVFFFYAERIKEYVENFYRYSEAGLGRRSFSIILSSGNHTEKLSIISQWISHHKVNFQSYQPQDQPFHLFHYHIIDIQFRPKKCFFNWSVILIIRGLSPNLGLKVFNSVVRGDFRAVEVLESTFIICR